MRKEFRFYRDVERERPHMTESKLIAQQAMEIANLKEAVNLYKENNRKIHMMIYGIGGPLNDSKIAYNKEQKQIFFHIGDLVEVDDDEE